MLEIMQGTADNVLGIKATGKVTADDYQRVLLPAIQEKAERHTKFRLLYVLGDDFDEFSAAAAWEDAKVGLRHFLHFERIAVVSDADRVRRMIRAVAFMLPGEVRVYGTSACDEAWAWISEPAARGSLRFELDRKRGVLRLEPHDELMAEDFRRVAREVDPYIEANGSLAGIVIDAAEFPGWNDFLALTSHARFIREHKDHVRRIALVTNSSFLWAVPRLATAFTDAELKRFEPANRAEALDWAAAA